MISWRSLCFSTIGLDKKRVAKLSGGGYLKNFYKEPQMSFHAMRVFAFVLLIFDLTTTAATDAQSMADRIEYRGVMINNPESLVTPLP